MVLATYQPCPYTLQRDTHVESLNPNMLNPLRVQYTIAIWDDCARNRCLRVGEDIITVYFGTLATLPISENGTKDRLTMTRYRVWFAGFLIHFAALLLLLLGIRRAGRVSEPSLRLHSLDMPGPPKCPYRSPIYVGVQVQTIIQNKLD